MRTIIIMAALLFAPYNIHAAEQEMSKLQLYGLLESMRSSAPYVDFEGIIVYHRDDKTIPARIMRSGNVEKITFFGGYYKQALHDGSGNTYLHSPSYYYKLPAGNLKDHAMELYPAAGKEADTLRYYDLKLSGEETIAGRKTWVISVVPTDKWRYQHRFCIDKNTKLLLDMTLFDEHLKQIERINYAALTFKAPPDIGKNRQRGQQARSTKMEDATEAKWGFTKDLMPPGFAPLRRSININHEKRHIEQWVITDGLVWVSVFIEKFADANGTPEYKDIRVSGLNMHTSKFDNTYVTAVGPTPSITLQHITKAIHTH